MTVDFLAAHEEPADAVVPQKVAWVVLTATVVAALVAGVTGGQTVIVAVVGLALAVVLGAYAAWNVPGLDRLTWFLAVLGAGATASPVVAASLWGAPGDGVERWLTPAGMVAVLAATVVRALRRDEALARYGLTGLVASVGVMLTAVVVSVQVEAFSHGAAATVATLVGVLVAGVLAATLSARLQTVADRVLVVGALAAAVGSFALISWPTVGRAAVLVGAALLAVAPCHVADRLPDGPQAPWRGRAVMAVAALALPVSGLVMVVRFGDQRPFAILVALLALVGLLLAVLSRLSRDEARQQAMVTELAESDPVTGLANRRRFFVDVADALQARGSGTVTVVLVAMESFAELRTRLGQATVEDLQVAVAHRLTAEASDALVVAHLNADVFGVLLGTMSPERAGARAQRLIDALREPIELPQLSLSVGAVVGLAGQPGATEAEELVASAELALAAARGGAGPLVRFTPELQRRDVLAAQLVGELSDAIARGEVVAYFQPQVDLGTGKVTGAEALVRWMHPALGLLGPAAFVPAAEVTGAIRIITLHVLDQALYWCARWARAGRTLSVSVNLSARDLLHARLVDDVREALARYGLPASRLELEVTETMAMADVTLSKRVLTDLARLGVTISIDDYGTGYGSLAYLQQLPVRRLKIDRSFVSRILDDEASMAIVRSTIELAGELGLDTIAEGVEDDSTAQRLREFGCGSVQGFGFAAPMAPESFERAIWRLEHRPRPELVPQGRPTRDVPQTKAEQAAFPSVAQAYHDLTNPGWWAGDVLSRDATGERVSVPRQAEGSPLSEPVGVPAASAPRSPEDDQHGEPQHAPEGPRLRVVEPDGTVPEQRSKRLRRREVRRLREQQPPSTGAGSVAGLRAAAASERTTGTDPA
ncbi:MAG: EAL domain-containing protein [Micrococcales bacterium]|nr:EAL domain-containing protein [Micrococcales bacterium]